MTTWRERRWGPFTARGNRMEYRTLGKTGLKVSALSLGTVELGMEYGIKEPGKTNLPTRQDAIALIRYAADRGINLFDTAPGYGMSEEILGEAIGNRRDCYIATKINIPKDEKGVVQGEGFGERIEQSIENSLRALRRDVLDILQIHNATADDIQKSPIVDVLKKMHKSGKIGYLGASVYGEVNAHAVIGSDSFDVIQLPYNMLDQRAAQHIFPLVDSARIGILSRSAFLKGALSPRAQWLPGELGELRIAAEKIVSEFRISWEELPGLALRFCLSTDIVDTVLVGTIDRDELDGAIEAERRGMLSQEMFDTLKKYAMNDERLLSPVHWPET